VKLPVAFGSRAKLEPVPPWKPSVAAQLLAGEHVDSNADRLTHAHICKLGLFEVRNDAGLVSRRRTDNSVQPVCTKFWTCTVLLATLSDHSGDLLEDRLSLVCASVACWSRAKAA
jgi:hypothetical protein